MSTRSTTIRLTSIGAIATGLCAGAVGVAVAAPTSPPGETLGTILDAAGVDWSHMDEDYTKEQYLAFWGEGYTYDDQLALEELWGLDATETKARAGQAILDGEALPFAPGERTAPEVTEAGTVVGTEIAAANVAMNAGYTVEDIEELAELWATDYWQTKVHVGELVRAGENVPVEPSGL